MISPVKVEFKEQDPEDLDYVLERKRFLYETDACVCVCVCVCVLQT